MCGANEELLQENVDLIEKIEQMQDDKRKYEIRDNSLELYRLSEELQKTLENYQNCKQQLSQEQFMNSTLSTDIDKTRKNYEAAMSENINAKNDNTKIKKELANFRKHAEDIQILNDELVADNKGLYLMLGELQQNQIEQFSQGYIQLYLRLMAWRNNNLCRNKSSL